MKSGSKSIAEQIDDINIKLYKGDPAWDDLRRLMVDQHKEIKKDEVSQDMVLNSYSKSVAVMSQLITDNDLEALKQININDFYTFEAGKPKTYPTFKVMSDNYGRLTNLVARNILESQSPSEALFAMEYWVNVAYHMAFEADVKNFSSAHAILRGAIDRPDLYSLRSRLPQGAEPLSKDAQSKFEMLNKIFTDHFEIVREMVKQEKGVVVPHFAGIGMDIDHSREGSQSDPTKGEKKLYEIAVEPMQRIKYYLNHINPPNSSAFSTADSNNFKTLLDAQSIQYDDNKVEYKRLSDNLIPRGFKGKLIHFTDEYSKKNKLVNDKTKISTAEAAQIASTFLIEVNLNREAFKKIYNNFMSTLSDLKKTKKTSENGILNRGLMYIAWELHFAKEQLEDAKKGVEFLLKRSNNPVEKSHLGDIKRELGSSIYEENLKVVDEEVVGLYRETAQKAVQNYLSKYEEYMQDNNEPIVDEAYEDYMERMQKLRAELKAAKKEYDYVNKRLEDIHKAGNISDAVYKELEDILHAPEMEKIKVVSKREISEDTQKAVDDLLKDLGPRAVTSSWAAVTKAKPQEGVRSVQMGSRSQAVSQASAKDDLSELVDQLEKEIKAEQELKSDESSAPPRNLTPAPVKEDHVSNMEQGVKRAPTMPDSKKGGLASSWSNTANRATGARDSAFSSKIGSRKTPQEIEAESAQQQTGQTAGGDERKTSPTNRK